MYQRILQKVIKGILWWIDTNPIPPASFFIFASGLGVFLCLLVLRCNVIGSCEEISSLIPLAYEYGFYLIIVGPMLWLLKEWAEHNRNTPKAERTGRTLLILFALILMAAPAIDYGKVIGQEINQSQKAGSKVQEYLELRQDETSKMLARQLEDAGMLTNSNREETEQWVAEHTEWTVSRRHDAERSALPHVMAIPVTARAVGESDGIYEEMVVVAKYIAYVDMKGTHATLLNYRLEPNGEIAAFRQIFGRYNDGSPVHD